MNVGQLIRELQAHAARSRVLLMPTSSEQRTEEIEWVRFVEELNAVVIRGEEDDGDTVQN